MSMRNFRDILDNGRFTFLDTETSGSTKSDRIIQIGIVEVERGIITKNRIDTLVKVDVPIHWGAQKIHGIRTQDLIGKPEFREIAKDVLDFIGDDLSFAHNAKFDGGMLHKEWEILDIPETRRPKILCTMPIAKAVVRGSFGIDALMEKFLPDRQKRGLHSAADDAELLAEIFLKIKAVHPDIMVRTLKNMEHTLRSPDKNPAAVSEKRSERRRERRFKANADIPHVLNPGVAEAIAQANASGSEYDAIRVRVGRDYVTLLPEMEIRSRVPQAAQNMADALEDRSHVLSALRMMVRGLSPDLCILRQKVYIEKAKERDAASTPTLGY